MNSSDERLRRVRESGAEGATAILSQVKGLGRDEIWKALRRTDGATGGFFSGNLSGFNEQRRDNIVAPCFLCVPV